MKGGYIDPDNVYGVCQGLVPTVLDEGVPWYERLRGRVRGGATPHSTVRHVRHGPKVGLKRNAGREQQWLEDQARVLFR